MSLSWASTYAIDELLVAGLVKEIVGKIERLDTLCLMTQVGWGVDHAFLEVNGDLELFDSINKVKLTPPSTISLRSVSSSLDKCSLVCSRMLTISPCSCFSFVVSVVSTNWTTALFIRSQFSGGFLPIFNNFYQNSKPPNVFVVWVENRCRRIPLHCHSLASFGWVSACRDRFQSHRTADEPRSTIGAVTHGVQEKKVSINSFAFNPFQKRTKAYRDWKRIKVLAKPVVVLREVNWKLWTQHAIADCCSKIVYGNWTFVHFRERKLWIIVEIIQLRTNWAERLLTHS